MSPGSCTLHTSLELQDPGRVDGRPCPPLSTLAVSRILCRVQIRKPMMALVSEPRGPCALTVPTAALGRRAQRPSCDLRGSVLAGHAWPPALPSAGAARSSCSAVGTSRSRPLPLAGFVRPPLSQEGRAGGSVELHCEAVGRPVPEIQWWFEGDGPGDSSSQLWDGARQGRVHIHAAYREHAASTVSIAQLSAEDAGTYECWASNDPDRNHLTRPPRVKWVRAQASLAVLEREWQSRASVSLLCHRLPPSRAQALSCPVLSLPPRPSSLWPGCGWAPRPPPVCPCVHRSHPLRPCSLPPWAPVWLLSLSVGLGLLPGSAQAQGSPDLPWDLLS